MDPISCLSSRTEPPAWLDEHAAAHYASVVSGLPVHASDVLALVETHLLPAYASSGRTRILATDLLSLLPVLRELASTQGPSHYSAETLFSRGSLARISPAAHTRIHLPAPNRPARPVFYSAVRNLIRLAAGISEECTQAKCAIPYFEPAIVETSSPLVRDVVAEQRRQANRIETSNASEFANTASYMGSKKPLAAFLAEALIGVLPQDGVVLDLMCGSGAAAAAFSRVWPTLASDAQSFCRILASVQGAGFSREAATSVLAAVLPVARAHAQDLSVLLSDLLDWEDGLLHGNVDAAACAKYRRFVDSVPTYPGHATASRWRPTCEVEKRKAHPALYPYLLFTAYFPNVYFGLRQCVEIDSLRYGIDQLNDELHRKWALGALIATLSRVGTTYGGHFAQPSRLASPTVPADQLWRVLEQRAYSVFHEFSVRLQSLAEESERALHVVRTVPGPWREALAEVETEMRGRRLAVYVDPPYKREEYSRYYHVLETLVSYSYPSCVGRGKVPDKRRGERFASHFFSRDREQVGSLLASIVTDVLQRGWTCAWSYATIGQASIADVVSAVTRGQRCEVRSFAVPHEHKAQGGHRARRVTEYVIIFLPR